MRPTCWRLAAGLAAVAAAAVWAGTASAATLDLTTAGSSGSINGAIFQQTDPQPTGTGVIDSFLRLQNNGIEQGYNTDARPVQFDEKTDPNFTRSLLLSDVPIVNINGVDYRQFLLDINESNGQGRELLSLDQLQIFQATSPTLNNYDTSSGQLVGATKIYDLDAGGDNSVLLNYDLNHGSGSGDMFAYIPNSLFDPSTPYVYLYSRFGEDAAAEGTADAGFEEWAVLQGQTPPNNEIPGPATLAFAVLGCGLGVVGYAARARLRAPKATA